VLPHAPRGVAGFPPPKPRKALFVLEGSRLKGRGRRVPEPDADDALWVEEK